MAKTKLPLTRRQALAGAGATAFSLAASPGWPQAKVPPFTVVIQQSTWYDGFRETVALYEKETGNKVEIDLNPFAGSMEKQRNSVRASSGQYDLLIMSAGWFAEMYWGGFLTPITDIDPSFKLDPGVYTLGDTIYFDEAKKTLTPSGKLMSMPINPNIPLLFYRGDLYQQAGLKAPATFAELEANAKKFQSPPRMIGWVQRGARGPHTVAFDFYPYLYGFGGSIFKDQASNDYTVTLNSEHGQEALDYFLRMAREAGPPRMAAFDQADLIQAIVTGRAAHSVTVVGAWPQIDDPTKSAVVDKMEVTLPPHGPAGKSAPGLGHWLGGISRNIPDGRKRAVVEFLRWFQTKDAQIAYAKAGGVPIHSGALTGPMAEERKFRWMKPLAEALPLAVNIYQFPEAGEVIPVLELGLNRAVAGEITSAAALNSMASEIQTIMASKGYKSGALTPLK